MSFDFEEYQIGLNDPRKIILGESEDDKSTKMRARMQRKYINRLFVKNKRKNEYDMLVKYGREKYNQTMPDIHLLLELYPNFPILLFPGVYGWVFGWRLWESLNGKKLRNSQLFKEYLHASDYAQNNLPESPENHPVGIVFKITGQGLFVLHDWSNSQFLKNPSHARLTLPATIRKRQVTTYLEPFDSLVDDLGVSWFS